MSNSLQEMRSKSEELFEQFRKQEEDKKKKREVDARFWTPTIKPDGTAEAIIRFLPSPKGENSPKVEFWTYSFEGPYGWYIEKSLASLKQEGLYDPMAEYNNKLWKQGEAGQQQARKQKRMLHYVSNILVIDDPEKPENNGKVFLYRYGSKIYDNKIKPLMFPTKTSGEKPVNPFSFWDGYNFNLVVKKQGEFNNYDSSYFARSPSAVADNDDGIQAIWDKEYPLFEFIDPKNYKTREQLQKQIDKVFGLSNGEKQVDKALEEIKSSNKEDIEKMINDDNDLQDDLNDSNTELNIDDILKSIK